MSGASSSAWRRGQVDLDEGRQHVGEGRRVLGRDKAPGGRHEQLAPLCRRQVRGVAAGALRVVVVQEQRPIGARQGVVIGP